MSVSEELSFDRVRTLYESGADRFTELVESIQQRDWDVPTPDTEWTVRDLVNHVASEALWTPSLLAGATIKQVGDRFDGDVLGKEPVRIWVSAIVAARAAVNAPDADLDRRTVHLSFGDVAAADYVFQLATDLVIHSWDLARGIGAEDTMPAEDVQLLWDETGTSDLSASHVFGAPVHVAKDADLQTRLLAAYGRDRTESALP